jgi:hypothetical protein
VFSAEQVGVNGYRMRVLMESGQGLCRSRQDPLFPTRHPGEILLVVHGYNISIQ